jgi:hypothetical protein
MFCSNTVPFSVRHHRLPHIFTPLLVYLVQIDNDAECVAILSNISSAVCKALKDKVKDHLDDGRHIQYDETNRERLKSVLPHNKLHELAFGQLDWLLRHRPNSSKLTTAYFYPIACLFFFIFFMKHDV